MNQIIRYVRSFIFIGFFCFLHSCSDSENKLFFYFSREYIFSSPEKQKKLDFFLKELNENWASTINKDYHSRLKFIDKFEVIAILPNPTFDTVLYYLTWRDELDGNLFVTSGKPICARYDSTGFCYIPPKMEFGFANENDKDATEKIKKDFKNMIIKSHYLNEDNSVDPSYWFRFVTDEGFFFDNYNENGHKSDILKKSKKDYFEYLIKTYYIGTDAELKAGIKSDPPKVKLDYSGWE